MTRAALSTLGLALCAVSFFLVAKGTARTTTRRSADLPRTPPGPTRVLMIGDSLSVGAFGESVQQHLAQKFGPRNVAAYASCGSSPENWLADEPAFYTKCGYREATPDRRPILRQWSNGRPPRATLTPKLEGLVRRHRPTTIVVQQGTNWMDRDLSDAEISNFTRRFIRAARAPWVRQIIWIAPPDHSALRNTQARIHRLINEAARRDGFDVIDSRQLTRYVPGKTGGDGVHYNSESSRMWAARVNAALDTRLRGRMASAR
jgi:hypothetical protein